MEESTFGEKVELLLDIIPQRFAPISKRFAAMILDGFIFLLPALLSAMIIPYLGVIIVSLIYQPLFESSSAQATPGKRLMGIRVESIHRQRISYRNALTRYLLSSISELILFIGHFFAFFTAKKQTLYDILAETVVVEGNTSSTLKEAWIDQLKSLFHRS